MKIRRKQKKNGREKYDGKNRRAEKTLTNDILLHVLSLASHTMLCRLQSIFRNTVLYSLIERVQAN
jgi:hypothetical protein